jgi:hypothetical protein
MKNRNQNSPFTKSAGLKASPLLLLGAEGREMLKQAALKRASAVGEEGGVLHLGNPADENQHVQDYLANKAEQEAVLKAVVGEEGGVPYLGNPGSETAPAAPAAQSILERLKGLAGTAVDTLKTPKGMAIGGGSLAALLLAALALQNKNKKVKKVASYLISNADNIKSAGYNDSNMMLSVEDAVDVANAVNGFFKYAEAVPSLEDASIADEIMAKNTPSYEDATLADLGLVPGVKGEAMPYDPSSMDDHVGVDAGVPASPGMLQKIKAYLEQALSSGKEGLGKGVDYVKSLDPKMLAAGGGVSLAALLGALMLKRKNDKQKNK